MLSKQCRNKFGFLEKGIHSFLDGFVCDECGEAIGSKNQECVNGEVCDPSDEHIGTVVRGSLDDVIEWILCNVQPKTTTEQSEAKPEDKQTGNSQESRYDDQF